MEIIAKITVSEKGQITIPKEVRERLNILKGDKIIVYLKDNEIIMKKPEKRRLVEILKSHTRWGVTGVEFQRKLREEWD
ncbi:MAG: AbrB/MazE/SpoVT family DNA-binding domain-containing protein [Candidatus Lokiarchaeota archaeon]|nr:AbrB/MazE/SpoVT family DNA-binding domain-containing protein [Candidatus Lokiarchaeota archaeon]